MLLVVLLLGDQDQPLAGLFIEPVSAAQTRLVD